MPRAMPMTAGAIALLVFAIAFIAAPRSCEGGLELYFWSGIVALVVLGASPLVTRRDLPVSGRAAWGAGLVVFGAVVWIAGLVIANVRIMCRLF